jgi:hypothetical protein
MSIIFTLTGYGLKQIIRLTHLALLLTKKSAVVRIIYHGIGSMTVYIF